MMTTIGAILILAGLTRLPFAGNIPEPAISWALPLLISCILADVCAALGMMGIEKITNAVETAIINFRVALRNRRT
jgi:drug/metabolite transporter (DMT)-like permease